MLCEYKLKIKKLHTFVDKKVCTNNAQVDTGNVACQLPVCSEFTINNYDSTKEHLLQIKAIGYSEYVTYEIEIGICNFIF